MLVDAEGRERQPILVMWYGDHWARWIIPNWRECLMSYRNLESSNLETIRLLCSAGF